MSQESSKTYFRPHQREEMQDEVRSIESMLTDPVLRAKIGNPGELMRARNKAKQMLEAHTPQPLSPEARDQAARREKELREEIRAGMPTAREMRACPPGAIGKHRRWEARNKQRIQEWKRIRMEIDPDNGDPDHTSVETLRPRQNTLNMENAIVETKDYYIPPVVEATNVASDEDRERWEREREEWERERRSLRMEVETLREQSGSPVSAAATPQVSAPDDDAPAPCGKVSKPGYRTRHIARCGHALCVAERGTWDTGGASAA